MHQLTTPREDQPLLTAVASVRDAALLAEVVELRAKNKQLEQALVSHPVIDQAWLVGVGVVVFGGALTGRLLHEELPHVTQALKQRARRQRP
jgi:hypothetical protein